MDKTCPQCGSEIRVLGEHEPGDPTVVRELQRGEASPAWGTVRIGGFCSNPDCPGNDSELAKAAPQP